MTQHDAFRAARDAYRRREWEKARTGFRSSDLDTDHLDTEDLEALAGASWWLNHTDEYVDAAAELHRRLLRDGDLAAAGRVAVEIGYTEIVRGRESVGSGWIARSRRHFAKTPDATERGYLLALDADVAAAAGNLTGAEEIARELLDLGDSREDPTLQALALFIAGVVAIRRGHTDDGCRLLDEALVPVEADEVAPEWAGNLYCRMMQLCFELSDLPRADAWTRLTERWCENRAPAAVFAGICRVHRVQLRQVHGEWDRAASEAQNAADELEDLDLVATAEAYYQLGEVRRQQGSLDSAETAYACAHARGRDPQPGLALLHLRRGHRRSAATGLDAALASTAAPLARAPLLAARAEVGIACDDLPTATRCVDELRRVTDAHRTPGWQADSLRWEGAVLLARRRPADAVGVLRRALALWQRMDSAYRVAHVRLDLAQAAGALGDHEGAAREYDEAIAVLEHLGARDDLQRLRAHRARPAALSEREVEVVAAISTGCTNRQAASRLNISERTVARHLANVYLKTGVSSRTAAVAWARDRALL
ncbi:LuxR C-terminal-related transcriptional regulator [Gordonia sp. PKS22-38]|uniref:LuxR C-terminal-related transcriptional regulator n=1 Tax=Gordonia prachuapensis TaxID=3115651 RepID=A0ABU7MZD0_9ACTN|nr:LuxR C-terminal-related transcriptional regulator [Gordonia sp. PKS22-38]